MRPHAIRTFIFLMAAALSVTGPQVFAQSEEDLFSGSDTLVTEPERTDGDISTDSFEKPGAVEIGGSISLAWSVDLENGTVSSRSGNTGTQLGLFFDARPETRVRVFGKFRYTVENPDFSGTTGIHELFGDLSMGSFGQLRVGKQAALWGVGYWWSPADILSLTPIDEQDPEAEREGSVAIKYSLPVGLGGISTYIGMDGVSAAESLALAARGEFLLGGAEFSIGGYWRPDGKITPRVAGTASFGLGALDAYVEVLLASGTELRRVRFNEGIPEIYRADELLFSGAAGVQWLDVDPEGRWKFALAAEYYYNGTGIADAGSYAGNRSQLATLVAAGRLSLQELSGYGRQYAAFTMSLEDVYGSGFGVNLGARSNLGELSGQYQAVAVWEPVTDFRLEGGVAGQKGPMGGEYSPRGPVTNVTASVRLFKNATVSFSWPLEGELTTPSLGLKYSLSF